MALQSAQNEFSVFFHLALSLPVLLAIAYRFEVCYVFVNWCIYVVVMCGWEFKHLKLHLNRFSLLFHYSLPLFVLSLYSCLSPYPISILSCALYYNPFTPCISIPSRFHLCFLIFNLDSLKSLPCSNLFIRIGVNNLM